MDLPAKHSSFFNHLFADTPDLDIARIVRLLVHFNRSTRGFSIELPYTSNLLVGLSRRLRFQNPLAVGALYQIARKLGFGMNFVYLIARKTDVGINLCAVFAKGSTFA